MSPHQASPMSGAGIRCGRLFSPASGRTFVAAFDHGLTLGAVRGNVAAVPVVEQLAAAGADGVLVSPGLAARAGHVFAARGAPQLLVRADSVVLDDRLGTRGEAHRMLCTPLDAVRLGADAIVLFLVLGTAERTFADNAAEVAATVQAAHDVGLPVIVETVLWGSGAPDPKDSDLLVLGCRIAAELGADVVKTEYPGDAPAMERIVAAVPAPVLVLGGGRSRSDPELLAETRTALKAGAAGVVYGRALWQSDDPIGTSERVRAVVHND